MRETFGFGETFQKWTKLKNGLFWSFQEHCESETFLNFLKHLKSETICQFLEINGFSVFIKFSNYFLMFSFQQSLNSQKIPLKIEVSANSFQSHYTMIQRMQSGSGRREIRKCCRNFNCLPGKFPFPFELGLTTKKNLFTFMIFAAFFILCFYDFYIFFGWKLTIFYGNLFTSHERGGTIFGMKNLPNFTLIFCRISVVAGSFVEA